jgi:hypothetical protein
LIERAVEVSGERTKKAAATRALDEFIARCFGLNRFDSRSVDAFEADVRRAEQPGWDAALGPDSQLRRRGTSVVSRGRRVSENRLYAAYDLAA